MEIIKRTENILVSVILATWKGDRLDFLQESLESIRQQSYTNLEILVVADGPLKAETQTYLQQQADADSRIRLLPLDENRGPAYTRNHAIAQAQGAYIAILDADDVALPERIERQKNHLEKEHADLVGSHYTLIDASGEAIGKRETPCSPQALRRCIGLFNPIANSTVMARREILQQHPYAEELRYGEDYALWITLLRHGHTLQNQPECLVKFRITPQFLQRRNGLAIFQSDWRNKHAALQLYPLPKRILMRPLTLLVCLLRLLPPSLLRLPYLLRSQLRYRA